MDKQPTLFEIGFSKSFELAFAAAVHLDDMQGESLQALEGKVVELWVAPVKFPLFCLINNGKIMTQTVLNGEADVTLKTGLRQFRVLAQEGYFENKYIRGDEAVGKTFVQAMESLEIDWEEHLSHYTGDLLAFKIGHTLRSAQQARQERKAYMQETIREYLQFEINALPAKHQVAHFLNEVPALTEQIDHLAQRIEKLTAKNKA